MRRIMKMLSHLLDDVLYSSIAAFVCMLALNDELAFLLYSVDMKAKSFESQGRFTRYENQNFSNNQLSWFHLTTATDFFSCGWFGSE